MMKILFRTNAGTGIGLGHIKRQLRLAAYFTATEPHASVSFRVNKEAEVLCHPYRVEISEVFDANDAARIIEQGPDMLILDSYEFDSNYLQSMAQIPLVVVFDDVNRLNSWEGADVIINGNIYANTLDYITNPKTALLLGLDYLLIDSPEITKSGEEYDLLITTGGADFYDLSVWFALLAKDIVSRICIIAGPAFRPQTLLALEKLKELNTGITIVHSPPRLSSYIQASRWVISASGSTAYEILSQRKPLMLFSVADNQNLIYRELSDGYAVGIGEYPAISESLIRSCLSGSYLPEKFLESDGKAAGRIKTELLKNMGM